MKTTKEIIYGMDEEVETKWYSEEELKEILTARFDDDNLPILDLDKSVKFINKLYGDE